jgi:hypothetical protein
VGCWHALLIIRQRRHLKYVSNATLLLTKLVHDAAPQGIYRCFESNITANTYCLNTTRASHAGAQAACAARGGHLAIYNTIFEQQQVEQYFTGMGFMLPG